MLRNVRNVLFPHDIAHATWGGCILLLIEKCFKHNWHLPLTWTLNSYILLFWQPVIVTILDKLILKYHNTNIDQLLCRFSTTYEMIFSNQYDQKLMCTKRHFVWQGRLVMLDHGYCYYRFGSEVNKTCNARKWRCSCNDKR